MDPSPLHRRRAARMLLPVVVAALGLPMGCASARQRLPSLEGVGSGWSWPSLPAWPGWASWDGIPLLSRLRPPAPGAIQGRIVRDGREAPGRVVVFLDPVDPDGSDAASGEAAVIRYREQRFSPGFLVLTVGQTVVFENQDAIYHRPFSYSDPASFDLGILERGRRRSVTLGRAGLVRFYCTLHPDESGQILVTPSPHFATVDAEGAFRIPGVPPGRYRLHAWSEARGDAAREVTVQAGTDAAVDIAVGGP